MSQAVLYHGPADYMVEYCKNTTECRRVSIFKDFEAIHTCSSCFCCDICMSTCKCSGNKNPLKCAFVC